MPAIIIAKTTTATSLPKYTLSFCFFSLRRFLLLKSAAPTPAAAKNGSIFMQKSKIYLIRILRLNIRYVLW